MLTRRQFVKAALAAGAASAVPPVLESFLQSARAGTTSYFFFTGQHASLQATCQALCDRIVPGPAGGTEAQAALFIDRFMSAFEVTLASVADGPAIYLRGNFSGRNPLPNGTGKTDDFLDSSGVAHFLGLTAAQTLSWKCQIYGTSALAGVPASQQKWASQVIAGTIPSPAPAAGLRQAYIDGLKAFDDWSNSMFGTPYAGASTEQQDLMLQLAGNVVLNAVTGNVPLPFPSPPAAPPAASALFPIISLHTFQATYGLPEYSWRHDTAVWDSLGYDGDTMPVGNSIYDPNMTFPEGKDPNSGYGDGLYTLTGGYTQRRPVSWLDPNSAPVSTADAAILEQAINQARGQGK